MALPAPVVTSLKEAIALLSDANDEREQKAKDLIEDVLEGKTEPDNDPDDEALEKLRQRNARQTPGERAQVMGGLFSAAQKAPGDLTLKERLALAKKGQAMSDGNFPIRNLSDLVDHAMPSFGRAKNKPAVKSHLLKRARALGAGENIIKRIEGYSA